MAGSGTHLHAQLLLSFHSAQSALCAEMSRRVATSVATSACGDSSLLCVYGRDRTWFSYDFVALPRYLKDDAPLPENGFDLAPLAHRRIFALCSCSMYAVCSRGWTAKERYAASLCA